MSFKYKTTSRKRRRVGQKAGLFFSCFSTTHRNKKKQKQLCDGSEPKEKKIYIYMWDYENYITDDKKKYTYAHTHTLKKGQSLIGEGTDGMANKSEEFFSVTKNSGQRSKIVDYHSSVICLIQH